MKVRLVCFFLLLSVASMLRAGDAAQSPVQQIGVVIPLEGAEEPGLVELEQGILHTSHGMSAFIIYFDELFLSGNDSLLITTPLGNTLYAFSAKETQQGGVNATPILRGGTFRVKLIKDGLTRINPKVRIEGICWIDQDGVEKSGVFPVQAKSACKVNVNCSPEGDKYQDEKNAVVKILLKKGSSILLASGALMNNTSLDNTPYVLLSDNCANGATTSDLKQSVFYFGYELPGCDTASAVSAYQTITGASFVARGGVSCNLFSDFYLVRLDRMVPESYQPYLLGWDRSGLVTDSVVCIHHGGGLFKQISTSYNNIISSTYYGGVLQSHWKVYWSSTASGNGVSAAGSIGAPLLDSKGRVIGVWSDGASSCANPGAADYFGKFSVSWNQYQSTPSFRLKEWLDPLKTGKDTLHGMYPTAYPPEAGLTQSTVTLDEGDSIHFWDISYGDPDQWEWEFPGGLPSQWTGEAPPAIVYHDPGIYDVMLVVSNAYGEDTLHLSNHITIYPSEDTISTYLDTLTVCADTVEIAVRVENLYHVRNAALTLNVDTAVVEFIGLADIHEELSIAGVQAYLLGSNIWITWPAQAEPVQIGSDTLAVIRLKVDSGNIALHWNQYRPWMCQYYDMQGNEYPGKLRDGLLHAVSCGSVSGSLSYAGQFLMDSIPILLSGSNGRVFETYSDSSGNFIFPLVLPGDYTIFANPEVPWGGVNSTDALGILRHYIGLNTLSGITLEAADVNGSGHVNATDALNAVQRFAQHIQSFPASDWISEVTSITHAGSDTHVALQAICRGDVDLSWSPAKTNSN